MADDDKHVSGDDPVDEVKEKISSGNVGGLLWSSPNNPSWSCLNENELKGIAEICDPFWHVSTILT